MVGNERPRRMALWTVALVMASAAWPARAELTIQDLTATAAPRGGPFYQDVNDALRAFAGRDFQTALARLQNAKKLTPALAPGELMMARLYFDAGVPQGGNAMLERAIRSWPQDPEAYVLLAERALAEGRLSEAELLMAKIDQLVEAFNESPRRRKDLRLRGYTVGATIDQARGNLDSAKKRLEALVQIDPENANAHSQLGRLLFAGNDQRGAYEQFKLAAQSNPQALPADLMMASLTSDKLKAQQWLDRAIKMNPEDVRTQVSAADYLLNTNQLEQAQAHADKAIELDPDGYESNLVAGLLARAGGNFESAAKHLSRAHLQQPGNIDVMRHLALALAELPDEKSQQRGLQFAQLIVRQDPKNPNYLVALAWVNYRLGRPGVAQRYLAAAGNTKALQLNSEILYFMANIANDRGGTEEAVKYLRQALNTDQPFAYRQAAEAMLAKLAPSSGTGAEAASTPTP